jgi:hypothetical protein
MSAISTLLLASCQKSKTRSSKFFNRIQNNTVFVVSAWDSIEVCMPHRILQIEGPVRSKRSRCTVRTE